MKLRFAVCPVLLSAIWLVSCVSPAPAALKISPLQSHGRLSVQDRQLVDESGHPVQLRGFSTHKFVGLDWMYTPDYLNELVQEDGVSVLRLALYTDPFQGGYISRSPGEVRLDQRKVIEAILADAEASGLYVIVDWHILNDGNPNKYKKESLEFFEWLSSTYSAKKNLIYEICNEPNGAGVTWEDAIRPYAEELVATIRKYDNKGIILVGSSNWSQDVDITANHPLIGHNLMYTFHFYAGSHGAELKQKVEKAAEIIPLFCSEWGTTNSSGNGPIFPAETQGWIDLLDAHGISWCNWSLSNTAEGSAALPAIFNFESGKFRDNLSESGKLVFELLKKPGAFEVRPAPVVTK